MAVLLTLLLILAMATHSSEGTWCICKEGVKEVDLQKTLDYACGAGADCNPTHLQGPCFNPDNVRAHCSYAVNSFYQRKAQIPGSCDFAGTAMIVTSDPSSAGCAYPASASAAPITTVTPGTKTPVLSPGTATTPTINSPAGGSPLVTTPTNGILGGGFGGLNNGLGPAGAGFNPDSSAGRILLPNSDSTFFPMMITLLYSAAGFWGA